MIGKRGRKGDGGRKVKGKKITQIGEVRKGWWKEAIGGDLKEDGKS